MAGKPPKQPKAPKRPRLRKVVDNDVPGKAAPLPTPHNRKANCIAELGSVKDYVKRLLEEVEADEAVPQGMCGVNLVRKAGRYNRVAQKVSWDKGVVRNANSAPLTSDE